MVFKTKNQYQHLVTLLIPKIFGFAPLQNIIGSKSTSTILYRLPLDVLIFFYNEPMLGAAMENNVYKMFLKREWSYTRVGPTFKFLKKLDSLKKCVLYFKIREKTRVSGSFLFMTHFILNYRVIHAVTQHITCVIAYVIRHVTDCVIL